MGIVRESALLAQKHDLDAVWIQVGAFVELHGEAALRVASRFNLAVWDRNGVATVGVPISHAKKWASLTVSLGISVGVAFANSTGYVMDPELVFRHGALSAFSSSGNPKDLGQSSPPGTEVTAGVIFAIETPGIFSKTISYKKICDDSSCEHNYPYVACIPQGSRNLDKHLGQRVGEEIFAIFPNAF